MTPEQIALVQASFASILPIRDQVASSFYERLFALDPAVRALFKGDMKRQRGVLMVAIATVIHGLKNQAAIVPLLEELGRRHVGYGVRPEHYPPVGEALVGALAEALGDGFTAEVRRAWIDAYDLIATSMLAGSGRAGTFVRAA
jgi:hemoglobin-like flavoprotein